MSNRCGSKMQSTKLDDAFKNRGTYEVEKWQ